MIVGLLIGAGATYAIAGTSQGGTTTTTALLPAVTTTTTTTEVSIEFEGPGVMPCLNTTPPNFPCADGFQIDSASLSAPTTSGGNGTLTLTLAAIGNYAGYDVGIALNGTGMLTAPAFGVEHTYMAQVPPTFGGTTTQNGGILSQATVNLVAGDKYEVIVDLITKDNHYTDEIGFFLMAS